MLPELSPSVPVPLQAALTTSSPATTRPSSPPSRWASRRNSCPRVVRTRGRGLSPRGPTPHPLSPPAPPAAPGSSPEPLACIEWESIEVIVKTASRSKCYIEFHSYCLEGEVAPRGGSLGWARSAAGTGLELCPPFPGSVPAEAQRSGENNSQSCDVPGFLRMGWSAKQLPVVRPAPCRALEHPPASSSPSLSPHHALG